MPNDFVTGLSLGQFAMNRNTSQWEHYAARQAAEAEALRHELETEQVRRSVNRSEVVGLLAALESLPDATKDAVLQALLTHYQPAFSQHAVALGLPASYADEAATASLHAAAGRLTRDVSRNRR